MVYGSDAKRMRSLRDSISIRGEIQEDYYMDHRPHYLPQLVRGPCTSQDADCSRTGGSGTNVHPMLTSMYTVWTREHNRIARELSYINSHWRDDKLFDETRKIVGAIIQHITYNEWLPSLVGNDEHRLTGALQLHQDRPQPYDWSVDPSVSQAFAVGVLQPMIHSMMTDVIKYNTHTHTVLCPVVIITSG